MLGLPCFKLMRPCVFAFAQLTTKPSTEVHPTLFTGTVANDILDWLQNVDCIAAHNVWTDQKQLQITPIYLKDAALNFHCSLPE